jgi:hypothetical protein
MIRKMMRVLCVTASVAVFSGCGSSGGGPGGGSAVISIAGDEAYRGPLAAGVAPVLFAGASDTDRNWLQSEIVRGLNESGAFATVIPLSARGESNEAEVIIDPAIVSVERWSGGLDRVDLRLRTQRKTTGQVGVDQVYRGKRSGQQSAIRDAVASAGKDLRRKYGG